MKIALTQLNYYVGDFEKNISKIKHSIQSAKKQKVDLIVFAEMAVCGFHLMIYFITILCW